jgi:hypothetical protein
MKRRLPVTSVLVGPAMTASGHFETKSDALSMRVYLSGPPAGADVPALGQQGRRVRLETHGRGSLTRIWGHLALMVRCCDPLAIALTAAASARRWLHLPPKGMSAERYRSVVIAMAIMWVMQPSVHKVIDVITVRHLLVSTARTMRVWAPGLGRAAHGVGIANLNKMFVDMIFMHVMQMTIVQIIDMIVMAYSRVPTVGTMLMCVTRMMPLGAGGHEGLLIFLAAYLIDLRNAASWVLA